MTKPFLNKLNLKPYSDSICSLKIGYSGIQNRIVRFLWLWLLSWFSYILVLWCLLAPFLLQNTLDFQIFKFSSLLGFTLKQLKPNSPEWETGYSGVFRLVKFGHWETKWYLVWFIISNWLALVWIWIRETLVVLPCYLFHVEKHICLSREV
jgi:hypothetical protein